MHILPKKAHFTKFGESLKHDIDLNNIYTTVLRTLTEHIYFFYSSKLKLYTTTTENINIKFPQNSFMLMRKYSLCNPNMGGCRGGGSGNENLTIYSRGF